MIVALLASEMVGCRRGISAIAAFRRNSPAQAAKCSSLSPSGTPMAKNRSNICEETPKKFRLHSASFLLPDEPATLDQNRQSPGPRKAPGAERSNSWPRPIRLEDRVSEVRKVAAGSFIPKRSITTGSKLSKASQPPAAPTMPALETLASSSYKQPATVPRINEIPASRRRRNQDVAREKLIPGGRKSYRPPDSLPHFKTIHAAFGLSDLDELPSLKEFEALAQAALGSDEGIPEFNRRRGAGTTVVEGEFVTEADRGELTPKYRIQRSDVSADASDRNC